MEILEDKNHKIKVVALLDAIKLYFFHFNFKNMKSSKLDCHLVILNILLLHKVNFL